MDILDDPYSEGKEVISHNPWISYSHFWHLMREFGVTTREIDQLDEHPLQSRQIRSLVAKVLGMNAADLPDPDQEINEFCKFIELEQQQLQPPLIHCLALRKPAPWFDVGTLKRVLKREKLENKKSQGSTCLLL